MNLLCVIDCETGGKDALKHPITQLAFQLVEPENFTTLASFNTIIKPYDNLTIEKEAIDYTRVTMRMIQESGVDIKLVLKQFVEALKSGTGKAVRAKPIIVGHNVTFDIDFLDYMFAYCNKSLRQFFDESHLCTMRLMKLVEAGQLKSSDEGRYTLTACCARMGITLKNAHGAHNDVEATRLLLKALINVTRGNRKQSTAPSTDTTEKQPAKARNSFFFEL